MVILVSSLLIMGNAGFISSTLTRLDTSIAERNVGPKALSPEPA